MFTQTSEITIVDASVFDTNVHDRIVEAKNEMESFFRSKLQKKDEEVTVTDNLTVSVNEFKAEQEKLNQLLNQLQEERDSLNERERLHKEEVNKFELVKNGLHQAWTEYDRLKVDLDNQFFELSQEMKQLEHDRNLASNCSEQLEQIKAEQAQIDIDRVQLNIERAELAEERLILDQERATFEEQKQALIAEKISHGTCVLKTQEETAKKADFETERQELLDELVKTKTRLQEALAEIHNNRIQDPLDGGVENLKAEMDQIEKDIHQIDLDRIQLRMDQAQLEEKEAIIELQEAHLAELEEKRNSLEKDLEQLEKDFHQIDLDRIQLRLDQTQLEEREAIVASQEEFYAKKDEKLRITIDSDIISRNLSNRIPALIQNGRFDSLIIKAVGTQLESKGIALMSE